MKDLSRNISLNCDTCGNDQFEYELEADNSGYKCTSCGRIYTKDELIGANEFKINLNIEDIKKEVISEVEKDIKKAFRKIR